jgi:hypothetical protein
VAPNGGETWELKFPAGVHGIRRATLINSDAVRSAESLELRRTGDRSPAALGAILRST